MAAMMGGCCGVERGSRGRWRKPLRILVHGKGPEGRSLEWRSGGAGVGVCGLVRLRHFPRSPTSRHGANRGEFENSIIGQDDHSPLPDEMVVNLKAGDGVAYILPLLHWGSCYSTKMRRTLHGGYSVYSELPGMQPASAGHLFAKSQGRGYLAALTEAQRAPFRRWARRSEEACDITELMLRGASSSKSDGGAQLAKAVDMWHSVGGHALRGWAGVMQTLIMLAKAARRVYYLSALGQDSKAFAREVSEQEANWVRSLA